MRLSRESGRIQWCFTRSQRRSIPSRFLDDQMTLHPQSQAFLDLVAENNRPGWEELLLEKSRKIFETFTAFVGEGPGLERVEDIMLAGIPCRLYSHSRRPAPLVMFFHGGGWVLGSLQTHDVLCRTLALQSGCTVISVDFGRSPENAFPGPIDDCYAATMAAVERASELNVLADRIAVMGDSAGGHLAVSVAKRVRDHSNPTIALQVLLYPVIEPNFETESYRQFAEGFGLSRENMKWFWRQFLGDHPPDHNSVPSMETSLAGSPETILITAQYDVLRDEGESYARRLSDAGVPVFAKQYPGMLHGFIHFAGIFDDGKAALAEVGAMIRQKLC